MIRHTIELCLKESIRKARLLGYKSNSASDKKELNIWSTHSIGELYSYLTRLLEPLKISKFSNWNEIKEFIEKWQEADPDGTFGRCPSSTKGVPYEVNGNISAYKTADMGLKTIDVWEIILSKLESDEDEMNDY